MSHALSIGEPTEAVGTHGRPCGVCGFITFVPVEDEDAIFVRCRPCHRAITSRAYRIYVGGEYAA